MNDDELKARRVATANKIRVKASPLRMPLAEFNDAFRGRQVVLGGAKQREEMESATQQMFCDACLQVDDIKMEGTLLHVRIEDDPLGNFWKLATVRCFHCGFEEHLPLTRPDFKADDLTARAAVAGTFLGAGSFQAGIIGAPDVYVEEFRAQQEFEEKAQQAAKMKAQQQAQHAQIAQLQNQLSQMGHQLTATEVRQRMQQAMSQMGQLGSALGSGVGGLPLLGGDMADAAKYLIAAEEERQKKQPPSPGIQAAKARIDQDMRRMHETEAKLDAQSKSVFDRIFGSW